MGKVTNSFSEIGKYFKENDATSAMNKIMDMTNSYQYDELHRLIESHGGG